MIIEGTYDNLHTMDARYIHSYMVQNGARPIQILTSSFPCFPSSSQREAPLYYPRTAPTTESAIFCAQMNPPPHESWATNANPHPTVSSPSQISFADYWRQVSHTSHSRRHSSSTGSALSSESGSSNGPIGLDFGQPPPSTFMRTFSHLIPDSMLHRDATRDHAPPFLHLNTTGLPQRPGVLPVPQGSIHISPHHMSFSPTADMAMASASRDATWGNERSPIDLVLANRGSNATGAAYESGSGNTPHPLWHTMPKPETQPRYNQPPSNWLPQAAVVNMPRPHVPRPVHESLRPDPRNTQQPPDPVTFNLPHPVSGIGSSSPPDATLYPLPSRSMSYVAPSTPSLVDRTSRPALGMRRRALSTSAPASGAAISKRKPLPKIYGCDGCGKKFDRPSTLKVHEAIHTGAKDHLCEYCTRAFTVQSNMKRHMRVCKHKPLSPPMSLCYILCASPPLAPHTNLLSSPSFRAMNQVDGNSSLIPVGTGPLNTHHTIASAHSGPPPMIQTDSGSVAMVPYHPPHAPPHPNTVKGYKAPMIIAAMFSVQQNVPASLSKLTLVHLECDLPLAPIVPHTNYVGLYTEPVKAKPPKAVEAAKSVPVETVSRSLKDDLQKYSYSKQPFTSTSTLTLAVSFSEDKGRKPPPSAPVVAASNQGTGVAAALVEHARTRQSTSISTGDKLLTVGLLNLPDICFEERNSYYPRSRYCYHPAEYDAIGLLPGPGILPVPSDDDRAILGSA